MRCRRKRSENTRIAEQEWKRGTHGQDLSSFSTDPAVNLRPSGSGIDIEVRYVTRASERFEMRNRLYRQRSQPGTRASNGSQKPQTRDLELTCRAAIEVDMARRFPLTVKDRCRSTTITAITTIMGIPCRRTAMA